MLTAGLVWNPSGSKLDWFWPEITQEDRDSASSPGVAITGEDVELAQSRRQLLNDETVGRVGAMLLAENRRSVDYRYDEEDIEEPYIFDHLGIYVDPVVVLKAISCYEYQSCEHPGWITSEAHAFCEALRHDAIRHLKGYEGAPWLIDDPSIFGPRVRRLV